MEHYLAFDIGGTHIKYGIVNHDGVVLSSYSMETDAQSGGLAIIHKVIDACRDLLNDQIVGIAISTAGQVDYHKGIVIGASESIPGYVGVEIKRLISETFDLPVEVRNDVDCVALCEKWVGGHSVNDFIGLTVGTGIGGAIIINNEIYSGHSYSAGEWGYMLVEGQQFEKVASISGLINLVEKLKGEGQWTGENIFQLYDQGDLQIKEAVDIFYRHLAIGISNLIYIFNPEKVVIGGGITGRGDKFLAELKHEIKKHLQPPFYKNVEIVLAKHSNQSGMIGAVAHFLQQQVK